jgi:hypothetical protein
VSLCEGRSKIDNEDEDENEHEGQPSPKAIIANSGRVCAWVSICSPTGHENLARVDFYRQPPSRDGRKSCSAMRLDSGEKTSGDGTLERRDLYRM